MFINFYVGSFYYTLGNIQPEKRSNKNAFQLLGLLARKHLKKYGVDALSEDFMQDLAQIEQVRVFCNDVLETA